MSRKHNLSIIISAMIELRSSIVHPELCGIDSLDHGLCWNVGNSGFGEWRNEWDVADGCYDSPKSLWMDIKDYWFGTFAEFSGDLIYPVAADDDYENTRPGMDSDEENQFDNCDNQYDQDTAYGRRRLRLLDHCITKCREAIEGESNEV